jgi:hypothetical protein
MRFERAVRELNLTSNSINEKGALVLADVVRAGCSLGRLMDGGTNIPREACLELYAVRPEEMNTVEVYFS